MNCLEFLTAYQESGLTPELEKHLENCPTCRIELGCEKLLLQSVRSIQEFMAPDGLWPKISAALRGRDKPPPLWDRIKTSASGLLTTRLKPAVALCALFLMAAGIGYYYFAGIPWNGNLDNKALILKELEQTEDDYLAAIDKLARLVESEKDSISPEFYELSRERLNLLDSFIAQCKDAIRENRFSTNAQHYLFAAYQEKVETLKMMSEKRDYFKSM